MRYIQIHALIEPREVAATFRGRAMLKYQLRRTPILTSKQTAVQYTATAKIKRLVTLLNV